MSEVTVTDPELHTKKTVDSAGRVYLGKKYSNKEIRITVEMLDDD